MKRIIKKEEPKFFRDFLKKKKPANWDKIDEIRPTLRKYILEIEQHLQCAYCEASITPDNSKSHIDHFRQRHHFPGLTFEYNNLFVSCNSHNHCATKKDDNIHSKEDYDMLVNPSTDNPEDYFSYSISGKIISKNKKAKFTERLFNLNHPGLKQQRKDIAFSVFAYKESLELEKVIEEIGAYESFIRAIW